jgi:hypothetical protein
MIWWDNALELESILKWLTLFAFFLKEIAGALPNHLLRQKSKSAQTCIVGYHN